ncbi:MAG: sigma-70 region 4 domain-containing protein [Acidobacteriaceae bacterium]
MLRALCQRSVASYPATSPRLPLFASRDTQLESVGARMDLERLLGTLKPLQRQILEMAYLEDMPDLQIAATLGTTVGAVKCALYRVKRLLRDAEKKS